MNNIIENLFQKMNFLKCKRDKFKMYKKLILKYLTHQFIII